MRSNVRVLSIVLFAAVVALLPAPAPAAQDEVVFTTLSIDIWPDYDRPGVLVIYRATLTPGVSLPTPITLRIPAAAGIPTAVAEQQADGQLIKLSFDRRVEGDSAILEMTVTRPNFQVEYYDPAITRDGAQRSFVFTWPGDYQVGDLNVSVQQPDLAQNLVTEPPAARTAPGADGLVYSTVRLGAMAAGEVAEVQVSYAKASDQLSLETMPAVESPAATPDSSPADSTSSDSEVQLIVVVILGVVAIASIVVIVLRRRGSDAGAPPPVSSARRAGGGGAKARFCTQCGAGAGSDDRFCGSCGTALR